MDVFDRQLQKAYLRTLSTMELIGQQEKVKGRLAVTKAEFAARMYGTNMALIAGLEGEISELFEKRRNLLSDKNRIIERILAKREKDKVQPTNYEHGEKASGSGETEMEFEGSGEEEDDHLVNHRVTKPSLSKKVFRVMKALLLV